MTESTAKVRFGQVRASDWLHEPSPTSWYQPGGECDLERKCTGVCSKIIPISGVPGIQIRGRCRYLGYPLPPLSARPSYIPVVYFLGCLLDLLFLNILVGFNMFYPNIYNCLILLSDWFRPTYIYPSIPQPWYDNPRSCHWMGGGQVTRAARRPAYWSRDALAIQLIEI